VSRTATSLQILEDCREARSSGSSCSDQFLPETTARISRTGWGYEVELDDHVRGFLSVKDLLRARRAALEHSRPLQKWKWDSSTRRSR
jgi:hypothetical protein